MASINQSINQSINIPLAGLHNLTVLLPITMLYCAHTNLVFVIDFMWRCCPVHWQCCCDVGNQRLLRLWRKTYARTP